MGKRRRRRKSWATAAPETPTRTVAPMTQEQRRDLEPLLRRVPGMMDIQEYLSSLTFNEAQWTIVELSYPRFRKFEEAWVVLGTTEVVQPGSIEVHKKDGTRTHVQVKRVSEPFKHMGRDMVHGFIK